MLCHYCNKEAELVLGNEIYPSLKHLHNRFFYLCKSCDAYVGCHAHTSKPMGILANKELRQAKIKAHSAFDATWRGGSPKPSRKAAYKMLANKLGINSKDCHIGMFNLEMCNKVIEVLKESGK